MRWRLAGGGGAPRISIRLAASHTRPGARTAAAISGLGALGALPRRVARPTAGQYTEPSDTRKAPEDLP